MTQVLDRSLGRLTWRLAHLGTLLATVLWAVLFIPEITSAPTSFPEWGEAIIFLLLNGLIFGGMGGLTWGAMGGVIERGAFGLIKGSLGGLLWGMIVGMVVAVVIGTLLIIQMMVGLPCVQDLYAHAHSPCIGLRP